MPLCAACLSSRATPSDQMIREFIKSQTKKSQPLRCSAHPATLHIQLFFFEKLAILKSVLKCSAGNSASVHFFVQGSGRTRQHLALGLTNARLPSYQLNTAREEQEHSSTLAERLLNVKWEESSRVTKVPFAE